MIFRLIVTLILLFIIIFVPAGRLDYWQGWVLYGNYVINLLIAFFLFKDKQDLIKERMHPGKGQKRWDKYFIGFFIVFIVCIFANGSLDSGMFGWTKDFPIWLYITGFILFNISNALLYWSMLCNPFFSSVVRIQKDRGQTVVKTGPYSVIRHPGYTAVILGCIGIALMLGSIFALIPTGLAVIALIIRTKLEDETLQKELEGYSEYTKEVKYRLIPLIW